MKLRYSICAIFTLSLFTLHLTSTAQDPPSHVTTIYISGTVETDPDKIIRESELEVDLTIDVVAKMTEGILVSNGINTMLKYLNPSEVALERDILFDLKTSEVVQAWAYKTPDGKRHITLTTGLYRYLDKLIAAEVMAQQSNARTCAVAYSVYLAQTARENNFLLANQHLIGEILEPQFFADRHPDICPQFPHPKPPFSFAQVRKSDVYLTMIQSSFLFVMLHEFAHHKNKDVDIHLSPSDPNRFALQRKFERAADDFALDFFTVHKANPLFALPVMFLIADLEDFSVTQGPFDAHPATLSRVQDMFGASKKVMKSRRFQKCLKQLDPSAVQTSEQFMKLMERTF